MKIVNIVKTRQRFPDGSTSLGGLYKIIFDNPDIRKLISISGSSCASAVVNKNRLIELRYLLLKAKTEAVRDDLFAKHGADWRSHETEKTVLLEEEKLLLKNALVGIV